MKFKGLTTKGAMVEMNKEIDRRFRYAGNRTTRDAARSIFKLGEPKKDRFYELEAKIDQLRVAIENNRGDLTYNGAIQQLKALEAELKGGRTENDGNDD